jgi:hypothetical protein
MQRKRRRSIGRKAPQQPFGDWIERPTQTIFVPVTAKAGMAGSDGKSSYEIDVMSP